MGLDVYLYKYDNYEKTIAAEKEYEKQSEEIWAKFPGKYEQLTEEQKKEARKQIDAAAKKLGLGEYGEDQASKHCIELPSVKHPKHYFKIGYFRSSYNDSGINHKLSNWIDEDLYTIIRGGRDNDQEYYFQPDWEMARIRAVSALTKLRAFFKQNVKFNVTTLRYNQFSKLEEQVVSDEQEAMKLYLEQLKGHPPKDGDDDFASYSTNKGDFFHNGLEVVAVIRGSEKALFNNFQVPCMYMVYKASAEDTEYYEQALEIVAETCEYVLKQPKKDRNKFYLHWSG